MLTLLEGIAGFCLGECPYHRAARARSERARLRAYLDVPGRAPKRLCPCCHHQAVTLFGGKYTCQYCKSRFLAATGRQLAA